MDRDTGTYCRRCFGESGGCAECAIKDERARLREKVEAMRLPADSVKYHSVNSVLNQVVALLSEDANG